MERWPTPDSLAQASPAEVLIAWDRLGYPRRALRLQECAKAVVAKYHGELPRTREELLTLPGVGEYTADAVLAFAFHLHSVVLDTNIRRVLARWNGQALPAVHQTKAERSHAAKFVPKVPDRAWLWNASIMEFGALICTARDPKCEQCPVQQSCTWFQTGKPKDSFAHMRKTQKFIGTQREARGKIMAQLRLHQSLTELELLELSTLSKERFTAAVDSLCQDGLIRKNNDRYSL